MRKIKVLRHTRKSREITRTPTTLTQASRRIVPPPTVRNIRRGHIVDGMRSVNHIEAEPWEEEVAQTHRNLEQQMLNKNNRFFSALGRANRLLTEVTAREAELQSMNEEMEAANEELQATTEEMEATNEELLATTEDLRLAGSYSRTLIEASLDPMVTIGLDGKITDLNQETEHLTGRTREDLIGTDFSDYFLNPENAREGYKKAFNEGEIRNFPLEILHKNGQKTPVLYNARVFRDPKGNVQGVFAAARDVSDQKKTEKKLNDLLTELKGSQAKLIHAGKMGAMGTMTAGIAHELNNPMMGILNFIQYCLEQTDEGDKRHPVLKDAETETKRCSDIIQNLLTFSRMEQEGEENFQKQDITLVLDRVLKLLAHRIRTENIQVNTEIHKKTPKVWMKENNIQQVVLNLMDNAMDSLRESAEKTIFVTAEPKKRTVVLRITDSGCGIPPENLDKIFDPFFTTKSQGKGTGLGLSICHSLVAAHGGTLRCDSTPGKGTTFTLALPVDKRQGDRK